MPGHQPSLVNTSLWQTPQACTLIRTCPGLGWGISRSTIWKSAPGPAICAAFIVAMATVVVLIPLSLHLEDDFQLDRRTQREARDAIDQPAWALVPSEHLL